MVVRAQYDAFQQKGDELELINIHAFNEWDDKVRFFLLFNAKTSRAACIRGGRLA